MMLEIVKKCFFPMLFFLGFIDLCDFLHSFIDLSDIAG